MLEVVLYALPLAVTLSFAAGPIFFVIIETSINQGKTKALMIDLGAVTADAIFIAIAFFGSQSLLDSLENNPWVTLVSGLAILVFGLYYFMKSRVSGQFQRGAQISRKRHFFAKGFLLNFMNIGVLFYWIASSVAIGSLLNHKAEKMLSFYLLVLVFYLLIDLFKIYFANKFKERLKGRKIQLVEKVIGLVLTGFGLFLILKNFF